MGRCLCAGLIAPLGVAVGQVEYRYVEQASGADQFVLGYPPPVPQDSATPLDGFRSYDALHARHQDLMLRHDFIAGSRVGESLQGRGIWMYLLGDEDDLTDNAGPESSLLISGGLHAREWASPELTTGLIEAVAAGAGDDWLHDYVNENVRFAVLPVVNPDGFVQTQRYPDRVIVGADPEHPSVAPRDGRMRRKNMRGADGVLASLPDHLSGVDLNRNHSPYWAATTRSSSRRRRPTSTRSARRSTARCWPARRRSSDTPRSPAASSRTPSGSGPESRSTRRRC